VLCNILGPRLDWRRVCRRLPPVQLAAIGVAVGRELSVRYVLCECGIAIELRFVIGSQRLRMIGGSIWTRSTGNRAGQVQSCRRHSADRAHETCQESLKKTSKL